MAQQILNNGVSGLAFRNALNQNFSDLYNQIPVTHNAISIYSFFYSCW